MIGCEEAVDPIIGSAYPYTLWGFMNSGADTQRVRVYPISDEILPDGSQDLDARVFSTDLTTGERREWTYRAVEIDSLITGHVFWSPFRAEHEHRYRLEVVRSDRETASVEVTVPPPVTVEIDVQEDNLQIPVRIKGDVPNLVGVSVTYQATNLPPASVWPSAEGVHPLVYHPVTVFYHEEIRRTAEGLEVVLDMYDDFNEVQSAYYANCLITQPQGSAPDIWLRRVVFSAVAADSTWMPPGGVFDPEVLAVPGTFSNVENGYGFFGAGQGIQERWRPTIEARLRAGYNFEPQCSGFMGAQPVPECMDPPVPCLGDDAHSIWELWLQ